MTKRPDSWKILFTESEILNNRAEREFREDLVQPLHSTQVFQVALAVKNPPANAGDMRHGFDPEVPLEDNMATHSSILVWRIPWTEKLGRL